MFAISLVFFRDRVADQDSVFKKLRECQRAAGLEEWRITEKWNGEESVRPIGIPVILGNGATAHSGRFNGHEWKVEDLDPKKTTLFYLSTWTWAETSGKSYLVTSDI